MISNDTITSETFNSGLENLKVSIERQIVQLGHQLNEIKTETRTTNDNVLVNTTKIEMLQHSFYWGFAIIAFVVTFVGFLLMLAPTILEFFRQKLQQLKNNQSYATPEQVQIMIDKSLSKVLETLKAK